jgi:hypothetical protein
MVKLTTESRQGVFRYDDDMRRSKDAMAQCEGTTRRRFPFGWSDVSRIAHRSGMYIGDCATLDPLLSFGPNNYIAMSVPRPSIFKAINPIRVQ